MSTTHKSLRSLKATNCEFDTLCKPVFDNLTKKLSKLATSSMSLSKKIFDLEPYKIAVYKCLNEDEKDPDIRAIKIASLLDSTMKALTTNLPSTYMGEFCQFYYTSIYQTYVTKHLGTSGSDVEAEYKRIRNIEYRRSIDQFVADKGILSAFYSVKDYNALNNLITNEVNFNQVYDLLLFLSFMKKKYSYKRANYSLTDFMISYSRWIGTNETAPSFTARQYRISDNINKPPMTIDEYERGCNCTCGTTAIMAMLRLLSSRDRISTSAESFKLIDDQTNKNGCHIFLRWDLSESITINIETTNDYLIYDTSGGFYHHLLEKIVPNSITIQTKLDTTKAFHVFDGSMLQELILSDYIARYPFLFELWHVNSHLDHHVNDMVVISSAKITAAELIFRLHRLIKFFPDSTHLDRAIDETMREIFRGARGIRGIVDDEMALDPRPKYPLITGTDVGRSAQELLKTLSDVYMKAKYPVLFTTFYRNFG